MIALIYAFFHYGTITIIPLSGPAVLFFSLACAFTWVEIMKWGVTKPFTCIKCMTGWIALLLALIFHVDHPYFYLPAGLFIGAVFEAIKMRIYENHRLRESRHIPRPQNIKRGRLPQDH
jgi:hypothetical protein